MLSTDAIDAFRRGDDAALRAALQLRPWEVSPLEVDEGPSPWPAPGSQGAVSWPKAQELRRRLKEAAGL